ncbi:MAG TPA: hypothetical protein VEQ85_12115, partial [Lacipirellulaceae bacterium]|nr:hypothetical protein [Lacipirellulaceae bacterium]
SVASARAELEETIHSGAARTKFDAMVRAQGGDPDAPRPVAPASELVAARSGYVAAIDAEELGRVIIALKGGRRQLGDRLDHSTGLEMLVRLGDRVEQGEPIARIFAEPEAAAQVRPLLAGAIDLAAEAPALSPLILERIA